MTAQSRLPVKSLVLASSGWLALVATWLPSGITLRPVIVAAFVLWGPGAALTSGWPSQDPLERAVIAVASSLAIAVIIAEAQAYTGLWQPRGTIAILALLTTCAVVGRRLAASKEPA